MKIYLVYSYDTYEFYAYPEVEYTCMELNEAIFEMNKLIDAEKPVISILKKMHYIEEQQLSSRFHKYEFNQHDDGGIYLLPEQS